ncbi:MAG TPA: DNA-directed RNA polymerase subunit omega [Armatimonadaceae bacterium]|jgi:DNA-directed RNA polymerase subunit omega|nr:DNA-directed RNA polymerase subunit omega [Armatimonadaceae bacterium]
MIYPSADKIEEQIDSKYALVILAAKRAKQLKEGSRPLVRTDSTNPLTVALEEIASGSVQYEFDEASLAGREAIADREAVIGKRELEVKGIDPLALPADDDLLAKAKAELGADLLAGDDALLEESEGEDLDDSEAEEEEEDAPLLIEDEAERAEI